MDDIDITLSGRELDVQVAEHIMEWSVITENNVPTEFDPSRRTVQIRDGWYSLEFPIVDLNNPYRRAASLSWSPSSDIGAAYQMEDKLERQGFGGEYVRALIKGVGAKNGLPALRDVWILIHATPEQRCRAALLVEEKFKIRIPIPPLM